MIKVVLNIFLSVFNFFLRIFKKALCCLKRRRRPSCDPVPLTNIGIVLNVDKPSELQSWGTWEEMPTIVTDYISKPIDPIQQKIEQYREQIMASPVEEAQDSIDFFQDMAPKIVKQKKVLLQQKETDDYMTKTNLSLAPDPTFPYSPELGVWEESQSWEDQTEQDWDANEILREKKRLDRERRLADQQRKKYEKDLHQGRGVVATKIS